MGGTLYVSDLDGTLLRGDERVSEQSCRIINSLVERGVIFSYATARSLNTASKAARGLVAKMPLIVYNGAFVVDNITHERILANTFTQVQAEEIYGVLKSGGIYPVAYSLIGGREKFSYNSRCISRCTRDFLATRKGDDRDTPMESDDILRGEVFYFTCIDVEEKLCPAWQKLKSRFNCLYQKDIYTGEQWLEIMPVGATKANAVLRLKELYGCDRVVSFGDGLNDIAMFEISDECYAVENAAEELKKIATGVIGSNSEDGVARWLEKNAVVGMTK